MIGTVVRNDPAGTQLRAITFDVSPPDYLIPGQFSAVTMGEITAPFAYASLPGEPVLFLAKDEGPAGHALASLLVGETVEMSPSLGPGFPLERVEGRPLVVLVNGSGMSAARAVIRAEIARGIFRPVHLLYGVLTPDRRAFAADLEAWGNAGIQVHSVIGAPEDTGWTGAIGFVQDVAQELGLVRSDVGVVLVGVPAMLKMARERFEAAGVPAERILVNF